MQPVSEMIRLVEERYEGHPYRDWVVELFCEYLSWDEAAPIRPNWISKKEYKEPKTRDRPTIMKDMKRRAKVAWGLRHDRKRMERLVVEIQGLSWLIDDDEILKKVHAVTYLGDPGSKLAVLCEEYAFDIPDDYGAKQNE